MQKATQEQQVIDRSLISQNNQWPLIPPHFSPEERRGYEDSVKANRDINNAINTAKAEAHSCRLYGAVSFFIPANSVKKPFISAYNKVFL